MFRGFGFNFINNTPLAIALSSFFFGYVHKPFSLPRNILEGTFGAILGYAYWQSDYNLAVPIIIHIIYDFTTLLVTWYSAKSKKK